MWKYVLKRILLIIPVLLGVTVFIFLVMELSPGDPASAILGAGATQEAIDLLNHELGYDRPAIVRLLDYIVGVFTRFDFGTSYITRLPVLEAILPCIPVSIRVAFNAITFAVILGVPVGILSAVKQYSLLDTIPTVTSLFLSALPGFWLGMVLLYAFSLKLGWLPSHGIDSWKCFILPMISLGLPYAAQCMRFTRSSMLDTIRTDYVRTARAKGAAERRVIWRHALQNALLPVITVVGSNFAAMLGGSVVTESLYTIPGIGTQLVTAIKLKDTPSVMGCTFILAALCSIILLIVDLLYAVVDPRIKAKYSK
ncbi:MAG: ABC transporter permease [Oscillospiraceae bacterium]|nr:ABC transporter permease [Oscillospiraceae bacterium]